MMQHLPETGYLRLPHIIGDFDAVPPIPAIIPVGKSRANPRCDENYERNTEIMCPNDVLRYRTLLGEPGRE